MPFTLGVEFDEGLKRYQRAVNTMPGALRDFKEIWVEISKYLEGKSTLWPGSPITKIWKTEGSAIGASWTNTESYESWKDRNWQDKRTFQTPIEKKNEQILTGQTLAALTDKSTSGAIREFNPKTMVFGVKNDYSKKQQEDKRILDFYPEMEKGFDQVLSQWLRNKFPDLRMIVKG